MLGLVLSVVVIVIKEMFNVTVRSEEDISQCCKYPVLASVPDMTAPTKGGYYGYGNTGDDTLLSGAIARARAEYGDGICALSRNPRRDRYRYG
ncbi:MAG: hypothetical protein IJC64_01020, partial [Clostridia bacterium]|nr:hypothetical protein [Clostridia bacterium]